VGLAAHDDVLRSAVDGRAAGCSSTPGTGCAQRSGRPLTRWRRGWTPSGAWGCRCAWGGKRRRGIYVTRLFRSGPQPGGPGHGRRPRGTDSCGRRDGRAWRKGPIWWIWESPPAGSLRGRTSDPGPRRAVAVPVPGALRTVEVVPVTLPPVCPTDVAASGCGRRVE
jgi:hypothetical protein